MAMRHVVLEHNARSSRSATRIGPWTRMNGWS